MLKWFIPRTVCSTFSRLQVACKFLKVPALEGPVSWKAYLVHIHTVRGIHKLCASCALLEFARPPNDRVAVTGSEGVLKINRAFRPPTSHLPTACTLSAYMFEVLLA